MPSVPFRVRALYTYPLNHPDDLGFEEGAIITVTNIENEDWYTGEYTDASGNTQSGMFPENYVETIIEPAIPARPKKADSIAPPNPVAVSIESSAPDAESKDQSKEELHEPKRESKIEKDDLKVDSESVSKPLNNEATIPESGLPEPKKNALFSRIASFDSESAPISPSKGIPESLAKKPFFGGRLSYVPPGFGTIKVPQTPQAPPPGDPVSSEPVQEDLTPKMSLKERIALLQKTQQEQAQKEIAPLKKRHSLIDEPRPVSRSLTEISSISRKTTGSELVPQESVEKSEEALEPEEEKEEQEQEEQVQQEANEEEEEEEDDEASKKRALAERMAKLSGGAGMFGMMGMSPFGMVGKPKKKEEKTGKGEGVSSENQENNAEVSEELRDKEEKVPEDAKESFEEKLHDTEAKPAKQVKIDDPEDAPKAIPILPIVPLPPKVPLVRASTDESFENGNDEQLTIDESVELDSESEEEAVVAEEVEEAGDEAEEVEEAGDEAEETEEEFERAPPISYSEASEITYPEENRLHIEKKGVSDGETTGYEADEEPPEDVLPAPSVAPPVPSEAPPVPSEAPPVPSAVPPVPSSIPASRDTVSLSSSSSSASLSAPINAPKAAPPPPPSPGARRAPPPPPISLAPAPPLPENSPPSPSAPSFAPSSLPEAPISRATTSASRRSSTIKRVSTDFARVSFESTGSKYMPAPLERSVSLREVGDLEFDVYESADWWLHKTLPPSLNALVGKSILYEVEEQRLQKRGGVTVTVRDFYILFAKDGSYVQKLVSVTYDSANNASFNIVDIPELVGPDQYEEGIDLFRLASKHSGRSIEPGQNFVLKLYKKLPQFVAPIGMNYFGRTIYHNESHKYVVKLLDIRPGDVLRIENARFNGHNKLHQKIVYDVGVKEPLLAVISEFDESKQKFRVLEKDLKNKIKPVSYKAGDMIQGSIKVFRPLKRTVFGW